MISPEASEVDLITQRYIKLLDFEVEDPRAADGEKTHESKMIRHELENLLIDLAAFRKELVNKLAKVKSKLLKQGVLEKIENLLIKREDHIETMMQSDMDNAFNNSKPSGIGRRSTKRRYEPPSPNITKLNSLNQAIEIARQKNPLVADMMDLDFSIRQLDLLIEGVNNKLK